MQTSLRKGIKFPVQGRHINANVSPNNPPAPEAKDNNFFFF
jgi:hypothetical protein